MTLTASLNARPRCRVGLRPAADATATLPNGVVGTSTYDNANRLTERSVSWAKSGTTLASASVRRRRERYTVDAVGNRSDRTDLAGTQTYSYDNDYRLTSVVYPGPTTTSYTYDAFDNRRPNSREIED